jgi:PAS domain S-box-containing protein
MSLVANDGYFLKVNHTLSEILGYSEEELLNKTWMDVTSQDDLEGCFDWLRKVKKGAYGTYEKRFIHKRGHPVWVTVSSSMVPDSDGKPLYYVSLFQDVSKRKQAEDDLRESEEKFQRAFHRNPSPMTISSIDGRFIDVNDAFALHLGYSREELIGQYASELGIFLDQAKREEKFERLVTGGGPFSAEEVELRTKTGEARWGLVSYEIIEIKGERFILGVGTDITERKRAEEVLQESERRYRLLAENVTDVIWTMDMNLRMTYESPSVTQLRGYTVEEAMAQSLEEALTPASLQVARKAFAEELAREESLPEVSDAPRTLELELKCKNGLSVWTEVKAKLFRDLEGKPIGILGVTRDISERKKAEKKLHIYQEQLRSLASQLSLTEERERRRLATDLHDSIAQLLAISKVKLDALRTAAPLFPVAGDLDEVRELVGEAIQQTRSLTFDLSPPVLYELGLGAGLEALIEKIQKLHGIRIHFTGDRQPEPLSEDTRILLFRAVQELLVNSIKHGRAKNARISSHRDGSWIRITVEDDGIGFGLAEIESEANKADKFGLFSIRERLHHLGGRFEIVSKPGQGTKATLIASLKGRKKPY